MKFEVEEDVFEELSVGDKIEVGSFGELTVTEVKETSYGPLVDRDEMESGYFVSVENRDLRDREEFWH
jgi:hypothetical protein